MARTSKVREIDHGRRAGYIAAWRQLRQHERARQLGWVPMTRGERIRRWLTEGYLHLKRTLTTT